MHSTNGGQKGMTMQCKQTDVHETAAHGGDEAVPCLMQGAVHLAVAQSVVSGTMSSTLTHQGMFARPAADCQGQPWSIFLSGLQGRPDKNMPAGLCVLMTHNSTSTLLLPP